MVQETGAAATDAAMSKKGTVEVFQTKISRNDRFAQMSHQEKLIEQKKREIQAKNEQKQKSAPAASSGDKGATSAAKNTKSSPVKVQEKKAFNFNVFSNDGSFLNQFKQMKEKKIEQKLKSFKSRDNHDRYNDDRNKNKWKKDSQIKDTRLGKRPSRFSDKPPSFEPKINISTTYTNLLSQQNFDGQSIVTAQDVTGQPLLKNLIAQNVQYPLAPQTTSSVIAAPPLLLNVPPPQIQLQSPIVLPSATIEMTGVDLCSNAVITAVALPPQPQQSQTMVATDGGILAVPPPCLPAIELANIPPPNPIQVHNIPQPEPINTLTIPPPAPLQVQNIPPPSPIQLNEIPNPKPLDILSIPTPNEVGVEKNISDPDFIKNIPPPNKSVPPPNLSEAPSPAPQTVPMCLPPPNVLPPTTMPPPLQAPPPPTPALPPQSFTPQNLNLLIPPPQPPPQNLGIIAPQQTLAISLPMSIPVLQSAQVSVANTIPPLMAQPIMPPPGMGIVAPPPPMSMSCPPPLLQTPQVQVPPPGFIAQPMMTMSVPPPPTTPQQVQLTMAELQDVKDMNAVFPPGSADYEAMASLGRMVAQCGRGIEDVVRQRKNQDPSLWFLFHKESAAYRQYQQLVRQFRLEAGVAEKDDDYRPEDIYECDGNTNDTSDDQSLRNEEDRPTKRKRRSRWGQKEEQVAPPGVAIPTLPKVSGSTPLSKITRSDPGLLQYAVATFGSADLSEEDWKKAEDHYKINMLYQDMLRKRQEVERMQKSGQNKYEYDSDEDTDGGTWEHKLREKEMVATQIWANELTRQAEGKHHIGDFLPPEEFKKFMEKSQAAKEGRQVDVSDYKDFKLKEDNIGFKMLQKLGWSEGQGLGTEGKGILEPVNKGTLRDTNQGLGLDKPDDLDCKDDEYSAYRKRMMLAYRFRPNPLNNPRRPYY